MICKHVPVGLPISIEGITLKQISEEALSIKWN